MHYGDEVMTESVSSKSAQFETVKEPALPLGACTGSKQWWSLLTSLTGRSSRGRPAVPPSAHLADYFSSKLSCSSTLSEPPVLEDCHHSLLRQFRIKKSRVHSLLLSLDVNNRLVMMV